jgi:3-oxoacyl-[acyl-carrier protein] reductase
VVRIAIVTGAVRGIGAAIEQRMALDGFAVGLVDLDDSSCAATMRTVQAAGQPALAVAADVSNEQSAAMAVERIAAELGPPTVLVNNAGITRDNLLFKMTLDDWDAVMGVHLRGTFLMTRATQKYMVEASYGRIVNLSSVSALGNRGQSGYSAARTGIQGLTKTLAIELGRFGVTANAVAPGFIETDMTAASFARMGVDFEEAKRERAKQIPIGRVDNRKMSRIWCRTWSVRERGLSLVRWSTSLAVQ